MKPSQQTGKVGTNTEVLAYNGDFKDRQCHRYEPVPPLNTPFHILDTLWVLTIAIAAFSHLKKTL